MVRQSALFVIALTACGEVAAQAIDRCQPPVGRLVSVQGSIELRRVGETQWQQAKLNDTVCAGDMIRIKERSRGSVALINDTFLRLDEKTTVTLVGVEEAKPSLLELCRGAIHFMTRTRKTFRVITPFVNAAVEGTEFSIEHAEAQDNINVFEGQVSATNEAARPLPETCEAAPARAPQGGTLLLGSGEAGVVPGDRAPFKLAQVKVRPEDSVQWALYYPPLGSIPDELGADVRDPRFYTDRAGLWLSLGRVDEARSDIQQALNIDPRNSAAYALQAIISVVQNDKAAALRLAQTAVQLDEKSSDAWIALSYAQQANFQIEEALASARKAVEIEPKNALAWARVAELELSLGKLDQALESAQRAASLNPNLARTQTVLGFANLTRIDIEAAKASFEKAIELDQADPLPRLGLGLAKIRESNLEAGRREIEIAASLDPADSLIRSYLGKAYFEERREKLAGIQFDIAKELDPLDPTPWFYDAIRKQTENQPVEALQDVEKSIELNDNRAVYRSRLLLDEDLAARSAKQASIYRNLGFEQLAEVEAYGALDIDPTNFSAHRLLADTFLLRSRHEIARVSETLQAQLWQPLNFAPADPLLLDDEPFILRGAAPSSASRNEFDPLFVRDGLRLQASGLVGTQQTIGDQILVSGLLGRFSGSLAQMHYETDGYQENLDLNKDLYDAFLQFQPATGTSLFAEARRTEKTQGDLTQNFFGVPTSLRFLQERDLYRIGLRHDLLPSWSVAGHVSYQNAEDTTEFPAGSPFFNQQLDERFSELQTVYRSPQWYLMLGGGYYEATGTQEVFGFESDAESKARNVYGYFAWEPFQAGPRVIAGLSAEVVDDAFFPEVLRQVSPKLGLIWSPWPSTTIRAAYFQGLRRTLIAEQTIEPSQVAGFNQFYDDSLGTDASRVGFAVDQKLAHNLYAGFELTKRRLTIPQAFTDPLEEFEWRERDHGAYLYWAINPRLATFAEYSYERFTQDPLFNDGFTDVRTHKLPIGIRLFFPQPQLNLRLTLTGVDQSGTFGSAFTGFEEGSSQFWLAEAAVILGLPRGLGAITLEGRNLFDEEFRYQETDIRTPTLARERTVFLRLNLSFQ